MNCMKIKKNDNIIVIKGKDRNKKGKVVKIFPDAGKIIVEGANMVKAHIRPKKAGQKGQIISREAPINIANVSLICPKCSKVTRIGYKKIESGEKVRICKKCSQEI